MSTSNLVPFHFLGQAVRIVDIDGVPFFVGKDVCDVLGYANANKAMNDHCKGVTNRYPLSTSGGEQLARVLPEGDVLRLIVRSNQQQAVIFERWVFDEVLPAIRKTGSYNAAPFDFTNPRQMLEAITVYASKQIELEGKLAAQAPHVDALARISASDGDVNLTTAAKLVGMPPRKFIARLSLKGWIFKRTPCGNWHAFADKVQSGLLKEKLTDHGTDAEGKPRVHSQVLVTPKGITAIAKAIAKTSPDVEREISACAALLTDRAA